MKISTNTANAVTPMIKAMAQTGTLPKSEVNSLCKLLKEASTQKQKTPEPRTKDKMLTADEVAERLGVCNRTVLRMNKAGQLKGVYLRKTNKSLRFSEREIEQFLAVEV